jgi:hypothetical protein
MANIPPVGAVNPVNVKFNANLIRLGVDYKSGLRFFGLRDTS